MQRLAFENVELLCLANFFKYSYILHCERFSLTTHLKIEDYMPLKPGPKPIADSTGEVDKRRRDNKDTPKNNPALKPSKSSKPKKK